MPDVKTKLYYASIDLQTAPISQHAFWNKLFNRSGPQAQLWINIAKYFGKNRFISRDGIWSSPWNIEVAPGFEMPAYDPGFSLSFEEITNLRALDIKNLITSTGSRVAVYYSGGIDSTVCLTALFRNLSAEELKHIDVCLSAESIIENPCFFEKHILNKINIIDSSVLRFSDIENSGNYAITCDQGDSIFGTELGINFYHRYKITETEKHFSEYTDLIISYFSLAHDQNFGWLFYEKLVQNINSSSIPVLSLHDFFWWIIFNIKYMECALRGSIYYYGGNDRCKAVNTTIINWFNHQNYQKWSMVNNNNGQKIRHATATTYKWAAKEYIHNFDKNDWYFKYKPKLASLKNIILRNKYYLNELQVFAMDQDYKILNFNSPDVRKYIEERLARFG